ncbi:hypothetical protein H4R34_003938, partial [Dimargaris verticillata]
AFPLTVPYNHQPIALDDSTEASDVTASPAGVYPHDVSEDHLSVPNPLPVPEPEPLPPAPPASAGYVPNVLNPYTPGLPDGDGLSPPGVPGDVGNEDAEDSDSGTDDDGDGHSDSDSDSDDDDSGDDDADENDTDSNHNAGDQVQSHQPSDTIPANPESKPNYNPENPGNLLNLDIPSALGLHGRRQLRQWQRRAVDAPASRDEALIKGPVVGIGIDLQPQRGLGGLLKLNLSLLGLLHINVDTYSLFGYDKNHRLVHKESHRAKGKSAGYDAGLKVDLDKAKQEEEQVDSVVAVIKGTDGTRYIGKLPYLEKPSSTAKPGNKSEEGEGEDNDDAIVVAAKPTPGKYD